MLAENPHTTTTESRTLSMPRLLLHAEGLAALLLSIFLYARLGASGWLFLLLLLVPDAAMLGYLLNPRFGAILYNLVHTYVLPLGLGAIALLADWSLGLALALIWLAHIGMDRTIGYGLKYPSAFKETHLGRV